MYIIENISSSNGLSFKNNYPFFVGYYFAHHSKILTHWIVFLIYYSKMLIHQWAIIFEVKYYWIARCDKSSRSICFPKNKESIACLYGAFFYTDRWWPCRHFEPGSSFHGEKPCQRAVVVEALETWFTHVITTRLAPESISKLRVNGREGTPTSHPDL